MTPYEGGVREPLIVRWPGKVKPGTTCDQIVALVDCLATVAAITNQQLPADAGPDSFSFLPVLLDPAKPVRDHIITQSGVASNPKCARSIRIGKWKLIPNEKQEKPELYDLEADLGETINVAAQHPDIVGQLAKRLEEATTTGRTR